MLEAAPKAVPLVDGQEATTMRGCVQVSSPRLLGTSPMRKVVAFRRSLAALRSPVLVEVAGSATAANARREPNGTWPPWSTTREVASPVLLGSLGEGRVEVAVEVRVVVPVAINALGLTSTAGQAARSSSCTREVVRCTRISREASTDVAPRLFAGRLVKACSTLEGRLYADRLCSDGKRGQRMG